MAGQPNTGKSTLFNRLTGLNQRVGNWTGKTVDRKEGMAFWNGVAFTFVDLPGCYGMTPHSPEEEVARDYLLSGGPDVVLAVVNAASVERSLYIVSELVALGLPVVVALNMTDVAEQEGRAVDAVALSSALGLPVIPLVGTAVDGTAADVLLRALAEASRPASMPAVPAKVSLLAEIIGTALPCAPLWAACKLFEGDEGCWPGRKPFPGSGVRRSVCCWATPRSHRSCTRPRQAWIDAACGKAVRTSGTGRGLTERWDRVLLHPLWGSWPRFWSSRRLRARRGAWHDDRRPCAVRGAGPGDDVRASQNDEAIGMDLSTMLGGMDAQAIGPFLLTRGTVCRWGCWPCCFP